MVQKDYLISYLIFFLGGEGNGQVSIKNKWKIRCIMYAKIIAN